MTDLDHASAESLVTIELDGELPPLVGPFVAPEVPVAEELPAEELAAEGHGPDDPDDSLSRKVRSGAIWSGSTTIMLRFANIAVMAIVARLVTKEEYGVFGLAVTAYAMLVSLAELGVSSAVARSDLDIDEIAPTVATIAITGSLLLAGAVFFAADGIAALLGSEATAAPLRVLSLSIALTGPFAVPSAQLQREFRQNRLFVASAAAFVPASAVLLLLAAHADGATAFAWSRVVGQLVMGSVIVASVSKNYWPGIRRTVVRPLLRFGVPLALASLLSQVLLNVDFLFVGRLLGLAATGLYVLAFNIATWSTAVLGSMLNGVVLPAFSRVKADGGDLVDALFRGTRTVALIACPIGALTCALSMPLITTIYGPQWSDAASVLTILSIYGFVTVLCLLFANVIVAMGRSGILLGVQAAALLFLVPALQLGIRTLGIEGAGFAHIAIICTVTLPVYLVAIRRSTRTGPVTLLRSVLPPLLAGLACAATAWAVALVPQQAVVKLVAGGLAGALVYGVLMTPLLAPLLPRALAGKAPVVRWVAVVERAARPLRERGTAGLALRSTR
jgi:PST family polysaccharide transporter